MAGWSAGRLSNSATTSNSANQTGAMPTTLSPRGAICSCSEITTGWDSDATTGAVIVSGSTGGSVTGMGGSGVTGGISGATGNSATGGASTDGSSALSTRATA